MVNHDDSIEMLSKRMRSFLQNRLEWKKLSHIQLKTIPVILDDKDTLVIAPTASGKTEAVLIPVLDTVFRKRLEPMSVLYILPLKALINDMVSRIEIWQDLGITVTKWHGDVNKSIKEKFIKEPTDILVITPESLEVILMKQNDCTKNSIFKNLKYIITDEIHHFADSDRGVQLNSLINRINKYSNNKIIHIGLSATVGNPEDVSKWLNYQNPATIVENLDENRTLQYKVFNKEYIFLPKILKKYVEKKILIFTNSRKCAEKIYNVMKKSLDIKNIFIHHSSIDRDIREDSEDKFKNLPNGFMIATSTLELGIDIGDLDIVVQIDSPNNVGSFLQRVGRSGRKTKRQRSIIIVSGMNILLTLAQILLIQENTIEKIKIPKSAKDIYFHQILSSIFAEGKIEYKKLYDDLKDCYVFSDISKKEYKEIISKMEDLEFLSISNDYLSLGYNFEKKFGKMNFLQFFSVFCPNYEYTVLENKKNVGTIDVFFAIKLKNGDVFGLAGENWKVTQIDRNKWKIHVERYPSQLQLPIWISEGPPVNYLLARKVYDILLGNFDLKCLKTFDEKSEELVNNCIKYAKEANFKEGIIPVEIDYRSNEIFIYTFAGKKANFLIYKIFEMYLGEVYDYNNKIDVFCSSFKIQGRILLSDIKNILYGIKYKLKQETTIDFLDQLIGKFYKNKFINFLPHNDQKKLKMDLLFDVDNLIDLLKNNEIQQVYNVNFAKWAKNTEEEDIELKIENNEHLKEDMPKQRESSLVFSEMDEKKHMNNVSSQYKKSVIVNKIKSENEIISVKKDSLEHENINDKEPTIVNKKESKKISSSKQNSKLEKERLKKEAIRTALSKKISSLKTYEKQIHDMESLYYTKEKVALEQIGKYLSPTEMSYDRFKESVESCNRIFYKQIESARNIIELAINSLDNLNLENIDLHGNNLIDVATGHIEKFVNEIEKKIEILKSIIEKIDELSFEWVINSSGEQSYSGEIEDVLDDMEKLIDSVKDYNKKYNCWDIDDYN